MMKWLYNKREKDFDVMTDFGMELRALLSIKASIGELLFMITVPAFNFMGEGLRDAIDPKMKF